MENLVRKITFSKIVWILFYLMIFFVLLNNSFGYLDPDFGWHLKVGEQIIKERAVPNLEHYNYTLEGKTWVDHEWLINASVYWVYTNLGYPALNILFALIIIASLIILNILVKKYVLTEQNSFILVIIFQFFGTIACLPHFGIRMQEITILNLSLLLLIIYHFNKHRNIKVLFFLPPLFYLWACSHGGFLIGLAILFSWLGAKLVEKFVAQTKLANFIKNNNELKIKDLSYFFIFSLAAVFTTLFTPYGLKLFNFLGGYYKSTFYLKVIQEWLPFYALPIETWKLLYISIVLIAIVLSIYFTFIKKNGRKVDIWEVSVSFLLIILALKSKRHFPVLFIVSFPLIIRFFSEFLDAPNDSFLNKKWRRSFFIIKPYFIIIFFAIISSRLVDTRFITDPFNYFGDKYPRDAVYFLKNHPEYDGLKLVERYGWGGYLIWTLPERKLFIDGRLPQYPFAGRSLLEEYLDFFNKDRIEGKINEHNIGMFLIPAKKDYLKLGWFEKYVLLLNEEKINIYNDELKDYLDGSAKWRLAYRDETSDIYIKK